jgi:hypothetical protein
MIFKKKLVIGADNVKGATKCVGWNEAFPLLSNYHEIYFYMPSLDLKTFMVVVAKNLANFLKLRDQLFEVLKSPIFTVFCVTAPRFKANGISNYDFLPFTLEREEGAVETFENIDISRDSYLANIKSSDGYFGYSVGSAYLSNKLISNENLRFFWRLIPILKTLHRHPVAFTVQLVAEESVVEFGERRWKTINDFGTPIAFAPKIADKPQDNLRLLISKIEVDETVEKPEWFSKIKLPGEEKLLKVITDIQVEKEQAEAKLVENAKLLKRYEELKSILCSKGVPLENSVDAVFDFLEIQLKKGTPGQEDRWLVQDVNEVPIEIKGHIGPIKTEDIRQIIERTRLSKNSIGLTQGLLIANPYCEIEPSHRKPSFSKTGDKIIEKSESFNVGLLDAMTLLKFVEVKLETGKFDTDKFKKLLFNSIGVIKKNDVEPGH